MEPEPAPTDVAGHTSDAALHAPMLDGKPAADDAFEDDVIRAAVAGGIALETAQRLYGDSVAV